MDARSGKRWMPIRLSVCLSVCLPVCLSLSDCLSDYRFVCLVNLWNYRIQIKVNQSIIKAHIFYCSLYSSQFFTHHSLVIFLVFLKGCASWLVHDVVFLHPPIVNPVALGGDARYKFHFRYKVHLEPLVSGIWVWSPTSLWAVKSSPGCFIVGLCRRYCDLVVWNWPIFHSQWHRLAACCFVNRRHRKIKTWPHHTDRWVALPSLAADKKSACERTHATLWCRYDWQYPKAWRELQLLEHMPSLLVKVDLGLEFYSLLWINAKETCPETYVWTYDLWSLMGASFTAG